MTLGRLGPVFSLARIPQPGAQDPAARSWLSATSAGLPGLILRGVEISLYQPRDKDPCKRTALTLRSWLFFSFFL